MAWLVQVRGACAITACLVCVRLRGFAAARQDGGRVPLAFGSPARAGRPTLAAGRRSPPALPCLHAPFGRSSSRFAPSGPLPLRGHPVRARLSAAPLRSGPPFGGLGTGWPRSGKGGASPPRERSASASSALAWLKCSARVRGRCALESIAAPPRPSPEGLGWLG
jgi:hypothetical protein